MRLNVYRKICSMEQLAKLASGYHAQAKRIVLCHGCFDIVHPGHLRYLQFAREQGQVLVVTLTADDAIENRMGPGLTSRRNCVPRRWQRWRLWILWPWWMGQPLSL
ncbi:MAG: adenylyltransferase/cytidyltransferase family protein [Phycisphaerales bacterium]|nr:adenylyltransferase/cytidyltransferase family protein [Phycisphaerales bacterium]